MTEAEWRRSEDAGALLDFLRQQQGVSPHWINLRLGGNMRANASSEGATARLDRALHRF